MNIELREFPAGTQVTKAGIAGGDPAPPARRSHILVDGRWVGHVGWDEGEQIVLCQPTTDAERKGIEQYVAQEFGEQVETIIAQPATDEPRDRRKARRAARSAVTGGGSDE